MQQVERACMGHDKFNGDIFDTAVTFNKKVSNYYNTLFDGEPERKCQGLPDLIFQ